MIIDTAAMSGSTTHAEALQRRLRAVLDEHLDPRDGSPFWLERAASLGLRGADDVRTVDDLDRLGTMMPADLRARPLLEYLPRRCRDARSQLVIGQTGGTTGPGTWTAFLPDEFRAAFVDPFTAAATHVGFPDGATWLFVGPGGPHIIGHAARAIARSVGSAEPFTVDFDPRWSRKLPAGSMGARRYLRHVLDQALAVLADQPVDVLFATPPVLLALAEEMPATARRRIRGVHYGGMAIETETMRQLQDEAYPDAVHLSGYGNTLLGCCLELSSAPGRHLDYFPHGDRLLLEVVDDAGTPAATGRVRATRLDHSMLIVRLLERDHADRIDPDPTAPAGFDGAGLRAPRPRADAASPRTAGLY